MSQLEGSGFRVSGSKGRVSEGNPHRSSGSKGSTQPPSVTEPRPFRIAYLATRFPYPSETFLQREVMAMRELGAEVEVFSLWGGGREFGGERVRRFSPWRLLSLLWALPQWLGRNGGALAEMLTLLLSRPWPTLLQGLENLQGMAWAVIMAERFRCDPPDWIHAPWASMPAAAGWMLSRLTGIPWSMGAHAYDLFEHGGDLLLPEKAAGAAFVRTSTEAGVRRLRELGVGEERILLVRRGLAELPAGTPVAVAALRQPEGKRLRLLHVGRLVEKKGQAFLLEVIAAAREAGLAVTLEIVGSGPLRGELEEKRQSLGLTESVELSGHLSPEAVMQRMAAVDAFIFTGKVAASGDRDGLPNVIGEAMSHGLPVLATSVGGVPEAIQNGENGYLLPYGKTAPWVEKLQQLANEPTERVRLGSNGRRWVEANFDVRANVGRLMARMQTEGPKALTIPATDQECYRD